MFLYIYIKCQNVFYFSIKSKFRGLCSQNKHTITVLFILSWVRQIISYFIIDIKSLLDINKDDPILLNKMISEYSMDSVLICITLFIFRERWMSRFGIFHLYWASRARFPLRFHLFSFDGLSFLQVLLSLQLWSSGINLNRSTTHTRMSQRRRAVRRHC